MKALLLYPSIITPTVPLQLLGKKTQHTIGISVTMNMVCVMDQMLRSSVKLSIMVQVILVLIVMPLFHIASVTIGRKTPTTQISTI